MPPTISKKTLPMRCVQTPLPIEVSARTVLVGMEFARAKFGVDDDSVLAMVDNAVHPKHLRFVFDLSCGEGRIRELRFWAREIERPESCARLNIEMAINQILGSRAFFRRGDLVVQWIVTRPHVSKLIHSDELAETGNRFMRATLQKFLRSRWIATPTTNGGSQ